MRISCLFTFHMPVNLHGSKTQGIGNDSEGRFHIPVNLHGSKTGPKTSVNNQLTPSVSRICSIDTFLALAQILRGTSVFSPCPNFNNSFASCKG